VQAFLVDLDGSLARLSAGILAGTVPKGAFREFSSTTPSSGASMPPALKTGCFTTPSSTVSKPCSNAPLPTAASPAGRAVAATGGTAGAGCARRYPWFGQVDVAGYFPSIRHDMLKTLLARRFKGAGFLALLGRIIDAYAASPGCGLPIGALTSQHFANFYLDGADRRCSPARRSGCVRYMDDIVWWGDSRAAVRAVRDELAAWLAAERGLALKPDASPAQRLGHHLLWLPHPAGHLAPHPSQAAPLPRLRAGWRPRAGGQIDALRLQQGYAAVLAPTLPADAAAWRREDLRRHPCLYDDGHG
jgi:hypothetical protein